MPRKNTNGATPIPRAVPNDETQQALYLMADYIKGNGFVPHKVLREKFGDRIWTTFGALLYRDWRMVREVRRPFEELRTPEGENEQGYEWADRRFSKSEAKKIPDELQWILTLVSPTSGTYGDFRRAVFRCRWTNYVLAALPVADTASERVFERVNGDIVIPAYCSRAMLRKVLPLINKPQVLSDHIRTMAVRVHADENIVKKLMPVVDERTKQGKGLTQHEALPPGTEFTLELWYPATAIQLEELAPALALAGQVVRLSPARSSGYGDFEVIAVNGENI